MNPILYAEDDADDVLFLRRAFKEIGVKHPLLVISDGLEVIKYLSGEGEFSNRAAFPYPCLAILDSYVSFMSEPDE